ncbi:MAG: nitrous oxide reductase accessory protein NosL [Desulfosarcinaceae bacterium]|jgi:copper chaperone NosL
MKKMFWAVIVVLLFLGAEPAGVRADDDVSQMPYCPICGMDRLKFARSRMVVHYEDGTRFGSCSLHCTALELAYRPGKTPVKIEVGDYASEILTDAEKAVWVLGGNKRGVMTMRAKWAFARASDAKKFIEQYGGELVDFETAMEAAFADMYKDTLMIREKRKKMKMMKKE